MIGYLIDAIALIVAGFSVFYAYRMSRHAKDSTEAAKSASQASYKSAEAAEKSLELEKNLFRKRNVLELHREWVLVKSIKVADNPEEHNLGDFVDAYNTLKITASYWNNKLMDQELIYESHWPEYKKVYKAFDVSTPIPGLNLSESRKILTPSIRKAYNEMEAMELNIIKLNEL